MIYADEGEPFIFVGCSCKNPEIEVVATTIINVIVEGLRRFGELVCDVVQQVMPIIKVTLKALDVATDNGLGEGEYFDNWVEEQCGSVEHDRSAYEDLLNACDLVSTGIGCKKEGGKGCKEPPKGICLEEEEEEQSSTISSKSGSATPTKDQNTPTKNQSTPTKQSDKEDGKGGKGGKGPKKPLGLLGG
ncbi:hypothetical protein DM02DRAFT_653012 [Periconia macrospinosa]|uniref:Uncharacterized protein n=1 Tax=Periconia macrospinosa TaxID=97972 RepID=A0A2V1E080_9PLEO|nr:hypothetical protein DM02DRAFT_653012 [Periconia macrospinosa]